MDCLQIEGTQNHGQHLCGCVHSIGLLDDLPNNDLRYDWNGCGQFFPLDEGTAAPEAMDMCSAVKHGKKSKFLFMGEP